MATGPAVLVLQHIECEPPGAFETELVEWGADLTRVELDAGDRLPDWREFDAIVAMGGPMGAYDEDRLSWLKTETEWIGEAVTAGKPFWGVCLGCQLLAASLGAPVNPGPAPEVGVLEVQLTSAAGDDVVFSRLPREFLALQWHGDTYALPREATHLACSRVYSQQAFRYRRAYGLQFHLEVTAELAGEWVHVPAYSESLGGTDAAATLLAALTRHQAQMNALARRAMAAWLANVVDTAVGGDGRQTDHTGPRASVDHPAPTAARRA